MAEDIEAAWLKGAKIDVGEYSQLVNVTRRLASAIGLERVARPINGVTQQVLDALKAGRADD
jgi:hypothetical protein